MRNTQGFPTDPTLPTATAAVPLRSRAADGYAAPKAPAGQSCSDDVPPQAVLKVLARLKYSVPLYKAESGFSILTEECLTFRTISP